MPRNIPLTTIGILTALTLIGCSSTPDGPASDTESSSAPSASPDEAPTTYELGQTFTTATLYGATLTVEIPVTGPPEVEQLRADLGVDPVSYTKLSIDNRQGTEDVSVYLLTLYDEDGTSYEFEDLSVFHIADWGPDYTDALGGVEGEYGYTLLDGTVLEENLGDDLSRKSTELHNQYLNGTNVSRLEVLTGWLASVETDLPKKITGITIQAYGMSEEVAMTPGGTMPSTNPAPSPAQTRTNAPAPSTPAGNATPDTSSDQKFTYEEALAALNSGMPYYEAFCLRYDPTTDGGHSQCEGIDAGTVDPITGEYIGD